MSDQYILVVDDEPDIRHLVQEILEDEGYVVAVAGNGAEAREAIEDARPRLMLLDIWMPDEDGVTLLKSLKQQNKLSFPVVMMSGHGTVETAVEATRHGAVDFIEKPLSLAKLLLTVEKSLKLEVGQEISKPQEQKNPPELEPLIGKSKYIQEIVAQVEELAKNKRNICIYGPPACGKQLVAKHIHYSSELSAQPCVLLSCDTLSKTNASRELLGEPQYGGLNSGYLDAAAEGVLILKDAELLPQTAQSILLDALQGNIMQADSTLKRNYNFRVISTSSTPLSTFVRAGKFLPELYKQLAEVEIECMPLSRRQEDIPVLLDYYVNWFVEKEGLSYRHFSVAAQNRLRNHSWSKNLLELKNLVQRLMILGKEVEIDLAEVESALGTSSEASEEPNPFTQISLDMPLREARAAFEKIYMLHQLQRVEGNIGELAKRVGMERTHLYRKLRGLEIDLEKIRD